MKTFRISTSQTGRRRTVRVVVYDTVDELQAASARYRSEPEGQFRGVLGISQPREMVGVDEDGGEHIGINAGVVRFAKPHMGAGIVAHEFTHMALAIYRSECKRKPLGNMKNEELFCHIVSDLVSSAVSKFYAAGIYEAV